MDIRNTSEVITDIKKLIQSKGYIYALCMIIFDDFHIVLEEIHEVNFRERLSKNEVSLLIGFLIQNRIDFSYPDNPSDIIKLKKETYSLLEELHSSLMLPSFERMQKLMKDKNTEKDFNKAMNYFYGGDNMFTEPIFYANDGVYEFQYSEFLEKKYAYDKNWLLKNRSFDINKTIKILKQIKVIHQNKSTVVNYLSLKEKIPEILDKIKEENYPEGWEEKVKEIIPAFEFYQYVNLLFDEDQENVESMDFDSLTEKSWNRFYDRLINLFVITKDDFDSDLGIDSFLENFSFQISGLGINSQFSNIGDFNLFTANPIIQLDSKKYFVPITYSVYEACYEGPYYWMQQDQRYRDQLAENRGRTSEEVSYEFLSKVFGKQRTFKSVKVTTKKGTDDTDIDVLCLLGSKALCVQVKSKKLTELSRKGDYAKLQSDFKLAVQDAYEQGLVSRKKILDKRSKFYNNTGRPINLSESIDEVYIMGVIFENYPSLTHQAHTLLSKTPTDPYPIFITVFDLELITHYLSDPYDLLYYLRQRISLMDYFKAESEIIYLGYHLNNKLWKLPNADFATIDPDYGGLIDRNYYPIKLGITLPSDSDKIQNRWKNKDFEELCDQLKESSEPMTTEVIFTLLDWDSSAREKIVKYIKETKLKTLRDNHMHNFSLMSNIIGESNTGVTYVSWMNNRTDELLDYLLTLCKARKYKSKCGTWIGFGSLQRSTRIFDMFVFNNQKWTLDQDLGKASNLLLGGKNKGTEISFDRNIGRNNKCPCGSGLKYKNCCGRKTK